MVFTIQECLNIAFTCSYIILTWYDPIYMSLSGYVTYTCTIYANARYQPPTTWVSAQNSSFDGYRGSPQEFDHSLVNKYCI